MATANFTTVISPDTRATIDQLQETTGINKKTLTDMAFKLLAEYYANLEKVFEKQGVGLMFKQMVDDSFKKLDNDLKKLAE